MPVSGWLLGNLEPYVRDTLPPADWPAMGCSPPDTSRRLLKSFTPAATSTPTRFCHLITFQEWFDLYRPTVPSSRSDVSSFTSRLANSPGNTFPV